MISDFHDMMPHAVVYRGGVKVRNSYGKVTNFSVERVLRARISLKTRRIASRFGGNDVVSFAQVWIAESIETIQSDDEIAWWPSPLGDPRFGGTSYTALAASGLVVSWDAVPDESGTHHTKLYLGPLGS